LAQHHRSDDVLVFGIILFIVGLVLPFLGLPFYDLESELVILGIAVLLIVGGLVGRRTGRAIYGE
jgi:hypothetical protein